LKMTARLIAGWMAVAALVSSSAALAGPATDGVGMALCAAGLGGINPSAASQADSRARAEDLCRRARTAMAENDLAAAETLVSQAEALGVEYGFLHAGDTPEKVRRDLERKKQAAAGTTPRPSQLFSPFSLGKKDHPTPSDPFLEARADRPGAVAGIRPLPDPGQVARAASFDPYNPVRAREYPSTSAAPFRPMSATPVPEPAGTVTVSDVPSSVLAKGYGLPPATTTRSGAAGSSDFLRQARLALAVGDVRRATSFVEQAKAQRQTYGPLDDTPEKVELAIERYRDLDARRENTEMFRRAYAKMLLDQAGALIRTGDLDEAERLAGQAARQQVTYGPLESKPDDLLREIVQRRHQGTGFGGLKTSPVVPAGAQLVASAAGTGPYASTASHAVYVPGNDLTRNVPAQALEAQPPSPPQPFEPGMAPALPAPQAAPVAPLGNPSATPPSGPPAAGNPGMALFQQGEAALRDHDPDRAYHLFQQAAQYMNQLDPITQQRLQGTLQMLSVPGRVNPPAGPAPSMVDEAAARQQLLARQVSAELAQQESKARAVRESDPKQSLELLEAARTKIEGAGLDPVYRDRLLARVDRHLAEVRKYMETHQPLVDLREKNERIREEVDRERRVKVEIQEKIALMVDDFNKKIDQQEYEKAEVVAKRAAELDPENPVVQQLVLQAKFVRRFFNNQALREAKERGFHDQMFAVDESSIPFDDRNPIRFPSPTTWEAMTQSRARFLPEGQRHLTEREVEIQKRLRTPVMLDFTNEPLTAVLDTLSNLGDINIHLDPQALEEYGVDSNTPVTIRVRREIMLKSALNLILEPLRLTYVIKDEVLKVTSEQEREGEVHQVVYNVADLVIPIPNFVPTARMGLAGAYHEALGNVGYGLGMPFGGSGAPLAVLASKDGAQGSGAINPALLAQMTPPGAGPQNAPLGFGPGGLGGGSQADFDTLMELITTTVQPETWREVGGVGDIAPFPTNLSLVISQTQDVHEEIVDLLEQLRRLQDLQVTIEVRFITLNDNFFERIGVDFDFDIDDDIDRPFQVFGRQIDDGDPTTGDEPLRNTLDTDHDRSVTVGLQSPGVFSADLDIPFTQDSFGLAVPQFGGFDASAGAQLGFAILSDIEAFFFINAAAGDRRSNVLQAPKVTLFNGQQAFVSDTSQSPFVISVIPVVGDFAAAQQPVIVVLNEGTHMTVQAVVSNDRRFVRLTVVPYFSRIGEVNTFQFTGTQTSTTDTTAEGFQNLGDADNPDWRRTNESDSGTVTRSGTTVQLPTFSFVTVTTTVSVPDGGTVLLGGIKRLSEGRNEFGTPILNKIPYVNRLFKNVGIGRETQSLMMMVTPRIIIQEEEEEKLGILPPT